MTRFDLDMDGSMEPSKHGRWVRYEDAQRKPLTDEEYEALVEDLGDWSRYVEVDTAHQTLTKHVRQVLAAHGIKENT